MLLIKVTWYVIRLKNWSPGGVNSFFVVRDLTFFEVYNSYVAEKNRHSFHACEICLFYDSDNYNSILYIFFLQVSISLEILGMKAKGK